MLFSFSISADTIFDKCNDRSAKEELQQISESGEGYDLPELLFDALCGSYLKDQKSLILFDRLIESLHLNSLMSQDMQFSFFKSFLQSYPVILINLKDHNLIDDLINKFLQSMQEIEDESIRLRLEEYYAHSLKLISKYAIDRIQQPETSLELINYAERLLFNAAKENSIIDGYSLPIILHLKLEKISSLILVSDFESAIGEINLFLKLSSLESFANESEANMVLDLLADLAGDGVSNRLLSSSSASKLKVRLFELIINNPDYEFNADFIWQLYFFVFIETASSLTNAACNETIFLDLLTDKRVTDYFKEFMSTVCFPSKEKFFSKIDNIYQKYTENSDYKSLFDNIAKSMIFYTENNLSYENILDYEEPFLDMTFLYSSQSSSEKNHQVYLDEMFTFCKQPENVEYCMEIYKKMNYVREAFMVDPPKEINLENIGNIALIFREAESQFLEDFEGLKSFTEKFFKGTSINFPTKDELLKYFDLNASSNELNISNFQALNEFINLYHYSTNNLFPEYENEDERLFYAKIYKGFSDFFIMTANLFFELAVKDPFFNSLKSQSTKDRILDALHASILAHSWYEYYSGEYDFQYYPVVALNLIMKVQKSDLDNSIFLDRYLGSNQNTSLMNAVSNIKDSYSSNYRINNYLTLKNDLSLDEIARLRFERDENTRNTRNSYEYLPLIDKPQDSNLALDLMKKISTDESIHYHFVTQNSDERIVFKIYSNHIAINNYDLTNEEVMGIYNEFSDLSFRDKTRIGAENLSSKLDKFTRTPSGITKIYYVLDGILRFIPFHAIKYKDKYLIENFTVSYLPSLSSFLNLKEIEKPKNFLGIGYPKFNNIKESIIRTRGFKEQATFADLPETKDEIISISGAFKNHKILLQDDATKENFLSNRDLLRNSMIYFATHNIPYGNSITDEPGLVLTPKYNQKSGILTISEISNNKFTGSIIALSACKTFGASYADAEAYSGIAQSFFLAGANGIYTTMWDIESISASLFNKKLFENYKNIKDLPGAVHKTSKSFIAGEMGLDYQDPFYWSPYIYLGK